MAFVRFAQEAREVDEVVDLVEGGDKGKQRVYQGPNNIPRIAQLQGGGVLLNPKPYTLNPKLSKMKEGQPGSR